MLQAIAVPEVQPEPASVGSPRRENPPSLAGVPDSPDVLACGRSSKPRAPGDTLTHYCIVRRDLPLGLIGANIQHAAYESGDGTIIEHLHAVTLTCPDEASLRKLWERLKAAGVRHRAIVECDGDYAGQIMSIGCAPVPRRDLQKLLSSLPLLK